MAGTLSRDAYREVVDRIRDCVRLHVPPRSVVLVASRGDEELVRIEGYRAWHFPQTETGVYAGHHPANSAEAIEQLENLQEQGAQYLVFPCTAAWWLDYYREFAAHLNTAHTLKVSKDDVCVIYELDESVVSASHEDDAEPQSEPASAAIPLIHLPRWAAMRVPRVLSIVARFGTAAYPHAERDVDELFERQMPTIDRTSIVVDNSVPRAFVQERRNGALLGGDNSAREFSAFDRALDFVGSDIWSYDLVHFATSAFKTLYTAYLDRFSGEVIAAIIGRPVCVGHIDCYNEAVDVRTFRSQHWIRSCFFVLPPAEVKALGRFVSVADASPFFSGDPAEPFRRNAPLSPNYRRYITTWLTGGDIGQGVEWHSSFELTRETLPAFERKAMSILNEQLLGIRLRALGCRLIDVTWLSAMLRRQTASEIPWNAGWRAQLANRGEDALILDDRPAGLLSTV
jgi:hypothetical protein